MSMSSDAKYSSREVGQVHQYVYIRSTFICQCRGLRYNLHSTCDIDSYVNKASELLSTPNGITPAPGDDSKARMVISRSQVAPHHVRSCSAGQYICVPSGCRVRYALTHWLLLNRTTSSLNFFSGMLSQGKDQIFHL